MTLMFPLKLAHSPLVGTGDRVIDALPCCHLSSEQMPAAGEAAVRCSFLTPFQALQFYFPLEAAFDGSDKVFMTLTAWNCCVHLGFMPDWFKWFIVKTLRFFKVFANLC